MIRHVHNLAGFAIALAVCQAAPTAAQVQAAVRDGRESVPYLQRRKNFRTELTKQGSAPQVAKPFETPRGWYQVTYPSTDGLYLKAWTYVPQPPRARMPAVVYFHGNFALHDYDFIKCKPFIDKGYVVMLPALRGENKNPGNCEMFLGEVEDGLNAVRWLARQKLVDRDRIYTFGHSAGGVISALLSLHEDVPIRFSGSSGGLYGPRLFDAIRDRVPFDLTNPVEREMRVLPGNIRWMKRQHVAFVGDEDFGLRAGVALAEQELTTIRNPQLTIVRHPGNHNSALADAMQRFVRKIEGER